MIGTQQPGITYLFKKIRLIFMNLSYFLYSRLAAVGSRLALIASLLAAVIIINGVLGCFIRVSVTDTVVLMASIWQAWQCWMHSSQSQSLMSSTALSSGASTRQCSYKGGASGRKWPNPLCDVSRGGAADAASSF